MRILHLVDEGPQACPTTFGLLASSLGRLGRVEERVLLLGGQPLAQAAQAGGVRGACLQGVPLGSALLGFFAARRRALELAEGLPERDALGEGGPSLTLQARSDPSLTLQARSDPSLTLQARSPFDLIHAWSVGALLMAAIAWPRTPRLLTLTLPPTPAQARWLKTLAEAAPGRTAYVPIASAIRRALLSYGVRPDAAQVLRPAIDMSMVAHARRAELRERWGIDDPQTRVIALLSDPPGGPLSPDLRHALLTVIIANESRRGPDASGSPPTGPRLRLLAHPDARHRLHAKATLRDARVPGFEAMLIDEPELATPWAVLPGADLAFAACHFSDARHPPGLPAPSPSPCAEAAGGGLSLLWAMAANVPIFGEACHGIGEIVEDRHSALLAKPNERPALAHRAGQLLSDAQLAWKLRDTARTEAYSYFSRKTYCDNLRGVYEQLLTDAPLHIPDAPATAGLRFEGRA